MKYRLTLKDLFKSSLFVNVLFPAAQSGPLPFKRVLQMFNSKLMELVATVYSTLYFPEPASPVLCKKPVGGR